MGRRRGRRAALAVVLGSVAWAACRGPEFQAGSGGGGGGAGGAGPRSVTVVFEDVDGTPLAERIYMFHDPAGEILAAAPLDASGTASMDLAVGSTVSVLEGAPLPRRAYSAVVADTTSVIRFVDRPPPEPNVAVNVTANGDCVGCSPTGTVRYQLSCAPEGSEFGVSGMVSYDFTSYRGCAGYDRFDGYITAVNASGTPIAQASAKNIMLQSGTITIGTTTGTSAIDQPTSVSNAPAGYTYELLLRTFRPDGRESYLYRDTSPDPQATHQLVPEFFTGMGGRMRIAALSMMTSTYVGETRTVSSFDFATIMFDVGSIARPRDVSEITLDGDDLTVSWDLDGAALGDAVVVHVASPDTIWTLASPAAASGTSRVPKLPAELETYFTPAMSTLVRVTHLDDPAAASYGELSERGIESLREDQVVADDVRFAYDESPID
jgi:hypothetical protein